MNALFVLIPLLDWISTNRHPLMGSCAPVALMQQRWVLHKYCDVVRWPPADLVSADWFKGKPYYKKAGADPLWYLWGPRCYTNLSEVWIRRRSCNQWIQSSVQQKRPVPLLPSRGDILGFKTNTYIIDHQGLTLFLDQFPCFCEYIQTYIRQRMNHHFNDCTAEVKSRLCFFPFVFLALLTSQHFNFADPTQDQKVTLKALP